VAPARISPSDLAAYLPETGLVWLGACSAESDLFIQGLAGQSLPGLTFTGIVVPGLNRMGYVLETGARFTTFFMTPELAAAPSQVEFLPLCYRDIRAFLAANPPQTLLVMLSRPDENGICSFGPVTDFVADLWQGATRIIAHINPDLPPTTGTPGIPFMQLTAIIEGSQALRDSDPGTDDISVRIAAYAASVIPDGATLQAGLGRIPEAVLRGLTGKRDLALHSGLIGDSTLHLLQAGALRADNPITAGVAIGTRRLYDAVSKPAFCFRPPSFTHDIAVTGQIGNFVTINSAIEVDLTGCAYAEATPKGYISGPGGASDFAAGARGLCGLRIIVMPATAARGTVSKIVVPGSATGPISLGRMDTELVITEHGIADLRLKSHAARRAALISIAAPEHQVALTDSTDRN
jgi:acyl-CoA hydrolase